MAYKSLLKELSVDGHTYKYYDIAAIDPVRYSKTVFSYFCLRIFVFKLLLYCSRLISLFPQDFSMLLMTNMF